MLTSDFRGFLLFFFVGSVVHTFFRGFAGACSPLFFGKFVLFRSHMCGVHVVGWQSDLMLLYDFSGGPTLFFSEYAFPIRIIRVESYDWFYGLVCITNNFKWISLGVDICCERDLIQQWAQTFMKTRRY